MKIEFTQTEIEEMIKERVGDEFPAYKVTEYHTTSYNHMIVTLERLPDEEPIIDPPLIRPPLNGDLNDE